MIGIMLFVTIVCMVVFYCLWKKTFQPLRDLHETAERIAEGELSEEFIQRDHSRSEGSIRYRTETDRS